MNKVTLIGNIARDIELHTTQNGNKKATFTVAVNRTFANAQGEHIADFFQCVAWREKAEFIHKYMAKGKKVGIVGELQNRSFDAQDGTKRYVTEVIIQEIEFLSPKESKADAGRPELPQLPAPAYEDMTPDDPDDLPF